MTVDNGCERCGAEGKPCINGLCNSCHSEIFYLTFCERAPISEGRQVKVLHKGRWTGEWVVVISDFSGNWSDMVECATITRDGFGKVMQFQRANLSYL